MEVGIPWYTLVYLTTEVGGFYRLRYLCYIQQAGEDFSRGQQVNKTACLDADGFGRGSHKILFWKYDEICAEKMSVNIF